MPEESMIDIIDKYTEGDNVKDLSFLSQYKYTKDKFYKSFMENLSDIKITQNDGGLFFRLGSQTISTTKDVNFILSDITGIMKPTVKLKNDNATKININKYTILIESPLLIKKSTSETNDNSYFMTTMKDKRMYIFYNNKVVPYFYIWYNDNPLYIITMDMMNNSGAVLSNSINNKFNIAPFNSKYDYIGYRLLESTDDKYTIKYRYDSLGLLESEINIDLDELLYNRFVSYDPKDNSSYNIELNYIMPFFQIYSKMIYDEYKVCLVTEVIKVKQGDIVEFKRNVYQYPRNKALSIINRKNDFYNN